MFSLSSVGRESRGPVDGLSGRDSTFCILEAFVICEQIVNMTAV